MATIQFQEREIVAGKWTSSEVLVPTKNYSVLVYLASSEWIIKAGIGNINWGLEGSIDGGTTWYLLVGMTSKIGYVTKTYMPGLSYTYIGLPGVMIRFYIDPSTPIKLSASGAIT